MEYFDCDHFYVTAIQQLRGAELGPDLMVCDDCGLEWENPEEDVL